MSVIKNGTCSEYEICPIHSFLVIHSLSLTINTTMEEVYPHFYPTIVAPVTRSTPSLPYPVGSQHPTVIKPHYIANCPSDRNITTLITPYQETVVIIIGVVVINLILMCFVPHTNEFVIRLERKK